MIDAATPATLVWLQEGTREDRRTDEGWSGERQTAEGWIEAAGTAHPAPASTELARHAVEDWAKTQGVALTPPAERSVPPLPVDWGAGEAVEQGLGRVRDALAGLDFDVAERELARAQALLRDHPELPHAAWLRAEVERAWSVRWLRGGDEERARLAWQRAAGLDGGRAAGLGERDFDAVAPVTASIRVVAARSASSGDAHDEVTLRLDGALVAAGDVTRTAGEHLLAILDADGAATWAAWVSIGQGIEVRIAAPAPTACSLGDVSAARFGGESVRSAGVRCGRWVAAIADASGSVRVAMCRRDACDALTELRPPPPLPPWTLPAPRLEARGGWPTWATWTLAGVGAVGAGFAIAAAAGAFKSSSPVETSFVNGGLQVHAF